jgi:hypothetical protein
LAQVSGKRAKSHLGFPARKNSYTGKSTLDAGVQKMLPLLVEKERQRAEGRREEFSGSFKQFRAEASG